MTEGFLNTSGCFDKCFKKKWVSYLLPIENIRSVVNE